MTIDPLAEFDGIKLDGLEFCSKVYALFESIRDAIDGPSRLRMRSNKLEKRLLEELLPVCKYVQAKYRIGRYISIRWVNGSQTYDAEIFQRGSYVSDNYFPANGFLEVTCAMHQNEYLVRELLEMNGVAYGLDGLRRSKNGEIVSVPEVRRNNDFIESYSNIVLKGITKKAKNSYPKDTILVIACKLNTVYTPDEWDALIGRIEAALPVSSFREIYLYDDIGQFSHSFFPRDEL